LQPQLRTWSFLKATMSPCRWRTRRTARRSPRPTGGGLTRMKMDLRGSTPLRAAPATRPTVPDMVSNHLPVVECKRLHGRRTGGGNFRTRRYRNLEWGLSRVTLTLMLQGQPASPKVHPGRSAGLKGEIFHLMGIKTMKVATASRSPLVILQYRTREAQVSFSPGISSKRAVPQ
jgi:hypothetical protein